MEEWYFIKQRRQRWKWMPLEQESRVDKGKQQGTSSVFSEDWNVYSDKQRNKSGKLWSHISGVFVKILAWNIKGNSSFLLQ